MVETVWIFLITFIVKPALGILGLVSLFAGFLFLTWIWWTALQLIVEFIGYIYKKLNAKSTQEPKD